MELMEAVRARHSVRAYTGQPIQGQVLSQLEAEIAACNRDGGLHIQLVTNEPEAFRGPLAHYGSFRGVKNYVALVGRKGPGLDEALGYYGQRVALLAQQLGLNTCWVALTYRKGKCRCSIAPGEVLRCVLAIGYGQSQGVPRKSKSMQEVSRTDGPAPGWFQAGVEAALLAPTATNQQRFLITLEGGRVSAKATGGFYSKVDLGIVKYHFEIGAGRENFTWQ